MERRIFLKLSSLLSAIGILIADNVMASTNSAPMQQLAIADYYSNTGSMYLTSLAFLL